MGLHARIFAACPGIGSFGARGKGVLATRHRSIPKIETAIRAPGSSLPSWLFVLWAAWNRKDLPGVSAGSALCIVDLHGQPGRFQRSQSVECSQSGAPQFSLAV